jgi:hypothetical protein
MSGSSEAVLERVRVREAAGVFQDRDSLEAAVDGLLFAGFDRTDIDVLAGTKELIERLGDVYIAAEDLADVPDAPRAAFLARGEINLALILIPAILTVAGAAAAALVIITTKGTWVEVTMAAILGAIVAGSTGAWLTFRLSRRLRAEEIIAEASVGGLILWVRVRSPGQEEEAQRILRSQGARAVRVHEIDLEKRSDDLPFASLRPDPWLGDERLGHF